MTIRGTALLLAVLAAFGAYIYVVELPAMRRPPTPRGMPEGPPLLAEPARVARVEVEEQGRRLTAVHDGGRWNDVRGRPWRGDAVHDLVATLGTLRPVMVVDPDPASPSDYGLGTGAGTLRILDADGRILLNLEVGERNPAWTGLYARVAGQRQVVLVGAVLDWELDKIRDSAPEPEP
jgi:hypothetical protein